MEKIGHYITQCQQRIGMISKNVKLSNMKWVAKTNANQKQEPTREGVPTTNN